MRNLFLGDQKIPLSGPSRGGGAPLSGTGITYTCGVCGIQWAKLEARAGFHYLNSAWPCRSHGTRISRGGSLIKPLAWFACEPPTVETALSHLPESALLFELDSILESPENV